MSFCLNNNIRYQSLYSSGNEIYRLKNMSSRTQTELDSANAMFNVENEFSSEKMTKDQCIIRRHTVLDTDQSTEEETISVWTRSSRTIKKSERTFTGLR